MEVPPGQSASASHRVESSEHEQASLLSDPSASSLLSKANRPLSAAGRARVLCYCALYLSVGPTLIIHNFNFPMALSGLGLLFSSAVSVGLVKTGVVQLEQSSQISRGFYFTNLLPIGASMAATLAAGNAVYLYLPVGFIQMLKAFTPVVTLIFLALSGIELPTLRVALSVLGICAGTAMASLGATSLDLVGLVRRG
ncbi:MAG: hypothetical protein SGPRY_008053 [Prymnesium sp.]